MTKAKPKKTTVREIPYDHKENLGTAEDYISSIKLELAKVTEATSATFTIGDLLAAAKETVPDDFVQIVRDTGLKATSNADAYVRIAGATHLRKAEFLAHLPSGLGALIDLANPK